MRFLTSTLTLLLVLIVAGCSAPSNQRMANDKKFDYDSGAAQSSAPKDSQPANASAEQIASTRGSSQDSPSPSRFSGDANSFRSVALDSTIDNKQVDSAFGRKIIKKAEIRLEADNAIAGQQRIVAIAAARGGFVVSTQASQTPNGGQSQIANMVELVVRVPSDRFDEALNDIRGVGRSVIQEKVTGMDVTEEYIDLEARIRTKKALEAQFMEIMKQARTVSDALEVQNQLGSVRTEIEQIEGRRRYLENQSSMSTITVTLQPAQSIVPTNGFFAGLKRAFGTGIDSAIDITLFFLTSLVSLLPIVLFIGLPLYIAGRYAYRRARRARLARELEMDSPLSGATAE